MSLNYAEILAICKEIKPLIEGRKVSAITEITPKSLLILLGSDEQSRLLLSFSVPCVRIHLSTQRGTLPTTPFISTISHTLVDSSLTKIEVLNEDRIVALTFKTKNNSFTLIAEFFSKSPNCYLLDAKGTILNSLIPSKATVYVLPKKPEMPSMPRETGETTSVLIEEKYKNKEKQLLFSSEKNRLYALIKNQIRRNEKKRGVLVSQLETAQNWEAIRHKGLLLQANLYRIEKGAAEITVEDWETGKTETIPLEKKMAPHEFVVSFFKQSQKLQESIPYLTDRLELFDYNLNKLNSLEKEVAAASTVDELHDILKRGHLDKTKLPPLPIKKEPIQKKPYREFFSKSGLQIWVGRDARSNNTLTFHCTNGNDTWLHASEWSGSHVVIKTPKGSEPDDEAIQDACLLALFYSKARRGQEGEVIITQKKFVTHGRKENPGMVNVSKHKARYVRFDENRFKEIRERKGAKGL